ncbi:hypothetical protein LX97_01839 [Nonlabens dokdonensis]|jgi:hypothetical protein|uniref:Secreted protein n=2 Tax=Nonlabens dokdonensis TaxID=328515 RepID=L7WAC6_NONDD|nr:DUF6702 family protein [Nonlabens dokdonensis]AGC77099.1 secreted protein [Nonlabens dokdonensis DSW-6]PZX41058.1 hypothetical protein LX97_01839 [Nonlabens dokdonensis]
MFKRFKILCVAVLGILSLSSFSKVSLSVPSGFYFDDFEMLRFRESENNNLHKYYISVSNATYSKEAKSVQMITRFFIDDLEDVINSRITNPIKLGDKSTIQDVYPHLKDYLDKKLQVKINGKTSIPSFLGAEYESDQIVLYIEIPSEKMPETISMKFNAFLELFEDQKNLVHMKINGIRRTLLFDKNKSTDSVKF